MARSSKVTSGLTPSGIKQHTQERRGHCVRRAANADTIKSRDRERNTWLLSSIHLPITCQLRAEQKRQSESKGELAGQAPVENEMPSGAPRTTGKSMQRPPALRRCVPPPTQTPAAPNTSHPLMSDSGSCTVAQNRTVRKSK